MSRFFSEKYAALTPYVPGEQPRDMQYLKLNTNESPYPPLPEVVEAAREEAARAHLYSDPTALALRQALAKRYGVTPDMVVAVNGSDEALNFAFMAFCDREHPAVFADITYGFYPVFANVNGIPYEEIPLRDDFTLDPEDYVRRPGKTVFIANPNAPTGLLLPLADVERIAASDPSRVVVIDEAYIDFAQQLSMRQELLEVPVPRGRAARLCRRTARPDRRPRNAPQLDEPLQCQPHDPRDGGGLPRARRRQHAELHDRRRGARPDG